MLTAGATVDVAGSGVVLAQAQRVETQPAKANSKNSRVNTEAINTPPIRKAMIKYHHSGKTPDGGRPMPFVVILALVGGFIYQQFFRYEQWVDPAQPTITLERDNLTGVVHPVDRQAHYTLTQRLWGTLGEHPLKLGPLALNLNTPSSNLHRNAPVPLAAETLAATDVRAVRPQPATLTVSAQKIDAAASNPLAPQWQPLRQSVDLNDDGQAEKLEIFPLDSNGLNDIAIYHGNEAVFFGQGKGVEVLPGPKNQWPDLKLTISDRISQRYRFNINLSSYEPINQT